MLKGIAASQGIAVAEVYKLQMPQIQTFQTEAEPETELKRLADALEKTIKDIERIKEYASGRLSPEELEIYDAHLMMAGDPEFRAQVETMIQDEKVNADYAVAATADAMVTMFESLEDAYFRERAADIKDVTFRLRCNLAGLEIPNLALLDKPVIIIAEDLTPSDTGSLNKEFARGFATETGGRTSHSAIMARSLEIPAVVGVKGLMEQANNGDTVILDAVEGEILLNPDAEQISEYTAKAEDFARKKEELKALRQADSVTLDGHRVELAGNIGSFKDVSGVLENGGEAVGLLRTEFLYMESTNDFPDEETQFQAYRSVLEGMQGKRVVIRTLDIGGDKKLNYFTFPEEMNPFLGIRAVRFCLQREDIFRTQLRALLRASVYGKLAVMFPMIATVDEFRRAKNILLEEKEKLVQAGTAVSDTVEVGLMIEIPAAAVIADQLGKEADFFSIGTNDLIQYTMAADRMNENVSYLYQPLNPSVLRLIRMTIEGAHRNGIWCGMCGEMAGDETAVPLLLGLGLDEFSMSAASILPARKLVRSLSFEEMKTLAQKALDMETMAEVAELVHETLCK